MKITTGPTTWAPARGPTQWARCGLLMTTSYNEGRCAAHHHGLRSACQAKRQRRPEVTDPMVLLVVGRAAALVVAC